MTANSADVGAAKKGQGKQRQPAAQPASRGTPILTKYFLVLLFFFGMVMVFVNHRLTQTVLNDGEGLDDDDDAVDQKIQNLSRSLKRLKRKHHKHHANKRSGLKKVEWAKNMATRGKDISTFFDNPPPDPRKDVPARRFPIRNNAAKSEGKEFGKMSEGADALDKVNDQGKGNNVVGIDQPKEQDDDSRMEFDKQDDDLDNSPDKGKDKDDGNDNDKDDADGKDDDDVPEEDLEGEGAPEKGTDQEKVPEKEVEQLLEQKEQGGEGTEDRIPLAGLNCEKYHALEQDHDEGDHKDKALSPSELKAAAEEMVYWKDIPQDSRYVSPFKHPTRVQYLTFEPDAGGWNNIRMAMETTLAMAYAMGRTLVLPPDQRMYLLDKDKPGEKNQRKHFSFSHFFHMESISNEHAGLDIIDMESFLKREAMIGNLMDSRTGKVTFPPGNRTNWNGASGPEISSLNRWIRGTARIMNWDPEKCMAVFPRSNDSGDWQEIDRLNDLVKKESKTFKDFNAYVGLPTPVDGHPEARMRENWAGREALCIYDKEVQGARHVHFPVGEGSRLLVHFYAFLFFQDWRDDLWMKRFVRDHVRYIDEIQCAAARVVAAVRRRARERAKSVDPSYNGRGDFDTFHIRRGDFQYKVTRFDADVIYDMSKEKLTPNATVYIATDEKDRAFFKPMMEHYDIVFLSDFMHHLDGVNSNYFGMIDQLVASRGRVFFGCWFSTFTGYINRLRGYHADHHRTPGYEQGIVPSWYYALKDRYDHMQTFYPVKRSYYAREFPSSWRLIDTGIDGVEFDNRDHIAMTE